MTNPQTDDDGMYAEYRHDLKKFVRTYAAAAVLCGLYVAAVAALAGLADRYGWYARFGLAGWLTFVVMVAPISVWAVYDIRRNRVPILPARIQRRHIDDSLRRSGVFSGVMNAALIAIAVWFSILVSSPNAVPQERLALSVVFGVVALSSVGATVFGPGSVIGDERLTALRRHAAQWAYVAIAAVVVAAFVVVQIRPEWAALACVWTMVAMREAPILALLVLDRDKTTNAEEIP